MVRSQSSKEQRMARPLNYQCACQCGRSKFTVSGAPLARLYCHCQICQALYKQPRADVTVWWGQSVELPETQRIEFKHYRLPPAINRGTHPSCGVKGTRIFRSRGNLNFLTRLRCVVVG